MFNFYSLSSSSSGNCLLVESNKAKILIDVGISVRKINTELKKINLSLADITAILITHEHSDHCKSLENIYNKYDIPVYTSKKTFEYLANRYGVKNCNVTYVSPAKEFQIEDIKITAFNTSHDAVDPYGYILKKGRKKISIATDLGTVTPDIINNLKNSTFAFLESNYDVNMLSAGKYPYPLKRRISSNTGHLSNMQCSHLITELVQNNTKSFMLGHLSKENNFPELAQQTITSTLISNDIDINNISLTVAARDCLSTLINLEE